MNGEPQSAQSHFEGWALLELMGHQREIGYVTTEYFGGSALFRVDTPEIPERESELKRPEYLEVNGDPYKLCPIGTKVKRSAIPAKTRFVSPGALYALNPCDEQTAMKAIEEGHPRKIIVLSIPTQEDRPLLPGGKTPDSDGLSCDCDQASGESCAVCDPEAA